MEESSSIAKRARRVSSYIVAFDFVSWSNASTALRFLEKRHNKKKGSSREYNSRFIRDYITSRAERFERERGREHHGVRELQSDSDDIDDDDDDDDDDVVERRRIVAEEKRRRITSATKREWNSFFVRFQFDDDDEDDEEGKTVAAETTSVPARLTRWIRS